MSSTQKYQFLFAMLIFLSILNSCTRDQTPIILSPCEETITYEQHMQLVLDNNCSFSGCHDGFNGIGNFSSYSGVALYFSDGSLKTRIVSLKDMPPIEEEPLTGDERLFFECWIIDGYPEN